MFLVCLNKVFEIIGQEKLANKTEIPRAAVLSSQHGLVTLFTEGLFQDPRLIKCRPNQICSD